MTENDRIKYLRKELIHLTQDEFGSRLGVTKVAISKIESGDRGVTEQMARSICREYNVRAEWLRDGTGEPFETPTSEADLELLSRKVMGDLPESYRRRLVHALANMTDDQWEMLAKISDMLVQTDRSDPTEDAEAAYIKRISNTAPSTDTTASSTTDANGTD